MLAGMIKEIREYVRYAVLAGLALAGLMAYLLYDGRPRGMSLVGETYLLTVLIVFAAAGLLFGLAATLADRRRGHWGFLVHRPARRGTLFAAKLAGLTVVYLAATSVAVVVAIVLARQSTFVRAPFAWSMLWPTINAQFAGVLWLATGMAIAARQARWIGSRVFPAIVAVAAVSATMEVAIYPHQAGLCLLGGLVVLGLLGGAYFVHNGDFEPQPLWARLLAGVVVIAACGMVLFAALGLTAELLKPGSTVTYFDYSGGGYTLGADGQPYRYLPNDDHTIDVNLTAQGVPLNEADQNWLKRGSTSRSYVQAVDRRRLSHGYRQRYESFYRPESHLQQVERFTQQVGRWWFVKSGRVLEGLTQSGEPVGTIGRDGFNMPGEKAEPFPDGATMNNEVFDSSGTVVVYSPTDVFVVNPTGRGVWHAFQTDAANPVCGVRLLPGAFKTEKSRLAAMDIDDNLRLIVVTPDKMRVISPSGVTPTVVPIDPIDRSDSFNVALLDNGDVAVLRTSHMDGYAVTALRGGRLEKYDLPQLPRPDGPALTGYAKWVRRMPELVGLPPVMTVLGVALAIWYGQGGLMWTTPGIAASVFHSMWPPMLIGVALTWPMLRRRYLPAPKRRAWLALAAAFGPVVPLTLLCLRSPPVRENCPACGKPRPVDQPACPHCAAAWPTPGDPATDVFDSRDAA